MGFNTEKFQTTKFERRTAFVGAPSLSNFFEDGEKVGFEVQALTGIEYGQVLQNLRDIAARRRVVEAAERGNADALAVALEETFSGGRDMTPDNVMRLDLWERGVVDRATAERQIGIRVLTNFPADFTKVTDKILELTEGGAVPRPGE